MKQAAYSEQDVKAMTDAFTAANPNVTVVPEFVAYDALHDKIVTDQVGGSGQYDIVLMDAIWPAEFAKAGIVTDITVEDPGRVQEGRLRIRLDGRQLPGQDLRRALDQRLEVLPLQQEDARRRRHHRRRPRPGTTS